MALDIPPTPTVEATSLSAVLDLASNPPPQPTRSHPGTAPLVLYIARVPGSRDVFLTPIKPREKVVTASDVQSSLYYLHYNCSPEYYRQSQSNESLFKPSSVNTDAGNLPTISEPHSPKRKAVPPPLPRRPAPPASPPCPINENEKPALPPRPGSLRQKVHRKPVLPNRSAAREQEVDLPVLPSRPLPPTPPQEEEEEPSSPSLHEDNIRLLRRESHIDETSNPYIRDYPTHPETLKQQELDSLPEPGALTLIRRDPGSNEQWNVATIHDPPIQEVSSASLLVPTAKRRTKKGGAPLYLDITNPCYAQFISHFPHAGSRISVSTTSSSEESEPAPGGVFRRRLYMPGSQFAEHSYTQPGHRKHGFSLSDASGKSEIPRSLREERHSVDLGSLHGNTTPRSSDRRSRGYTFSSPWDGRCEFTTGATGTSLRCRHYLPHNSHGAGMIEGNVYGASTPGAAVDISELRFNLPTSAKSASAASSPFAKGSYFSHRPHLSEDGGTSPTVVVDEDGRIDLSLGQERAGGGYGGKQAKLGKLIVEPNGFGMLDLLVAANLGLWWRAWERV